MSDKPKKPILANGSSTLDPIWDSEDKQQDYETGYKKPPKRHQFKKGQSGNSKGRPRKDKPEPLKLSDAPSDRIFEKEVYRPVILRENGVAIELPALQAVRRAQMMSAIKGNRFAQKEVIEHAEKVEQEKFQMKINRYVALKAYKARGENTLAEHRRKNLPDTELLPHPDDIVLNHVTGEAYVNGPECKDDLRVCEFFIEVRDHLFLRSAYAEKKRKRTKKRIEEGSMCAFMCMAYLIDHTLPRRFRCDDWEVARETVGFWSLSKKEIEQRITSERDHLVATRPLSSKPSPEVQHLLDRCFRQESDDA